MGCVSCEDMVYPEIRNGFREEVWHCADFMIDAVCRFFLDLGICITSEATNEHI